MAESLVSFLRRRWFWTRCYLLGEVPDWPRWYHRFRIQRVAVAAVGRFVR